MTTNKNRLAQLEKQAQPEKKSMTWKEFITLPDEFWERSIDTLADVLGATRDEVIEFLKDISNEQQTNNIKS